MKKVDYLGDDDNVSIIMNNDWNNVTTALYNLTSHAFNLALAALADADDHDHGASLGFGTVFFQWLASFAALYLLILDRTNWKTNILTALLVPYIFFSLPHLLFSFLRGQFGLWVAFVALVLRLFFPDRFPNWLELPAAIILLIVASPDLISDTLRHHWAAPAICLLIGCYLLQEHIQASGGFRNSFTRANGISNTLGILLLLLYPVWYLIVFFT